MSGIDDQDRPFVELSRVEFEIVVVGCRELGFLRLSETKPGVGDKLMRVCPNVLRYLNCRQARQAKRTKTTSQGDSHGPFRP